MTKFTLSILGIFLTSALFAQFSESYNKKNKSFSNGLGAADYSFNVGSQVGTTFKNSYYFSNYFAPSARLDLTKRVSVEAGIGTQLTQLNNLPVLKSDLSAESLDGTITSFFAYASGNYKLTEKVNFNATVMYEDAMLKGQNNSVALNKQYKDVSLGLNYNITNHFSINAQMQLSNRPYSNYYYNNSPFGTGSPIGYHPFY